MNCCMFQVVCDRAPSLLGLGYPSSFLRMTQDAIVAAGPQLIGYILGQDVFIHIHQHFICD